MPIFYALFENHLTSDPDDYMAREVSTSSAEMELNLTREDNDET